MSPCWPRCQVIFMFPFCRRGFLSHASIRSPKLAPRPVPTSFQLSRLLVRGGELSADLAGVRMTDVVVDGQYLLPGLPRLRKLADGVARVAKVGKQRRLVGAVAVIPAGSERDFEMRGGLGELSEVQLDVTEGVENAIFHVETAELGAKRQRLLADSLGGIRGNQGMVQ